MRFKKKFVSGNKIVTTKTNEEFLSREDLSNTSESDLDINSSENGGKKKPQRKKISRKKPEEKSKKKYFDEETHEAVVEYNKEVNIEKKNKLYTDKIYPAFSALIENLINVYGFSVSNETKKELKTECIFFLFQMIHKFDPTKGSTAFSYFNVVAKHWLTIKSKQNIKKTQQHVSIEDKESMTSHELSVLENYKIQMSCDEIISNEEFVESINKIVSELEKTAKNELELVTVRAIRQIIADAKKHELLNKRAVLQLLKEITIIPSKKLSAVMAGIKKSYREIIKREEFRISYRNE